MKKTRLLSGILAFVLSLSVLTSCGTPTAEIENEFLEDSAKQEQQIEHENLFPGFQQIDSEFSKDSATSVPDSTTNTTAPETILPSSASMEAPAFSLSTVATYSGQAYVAVNGNVPFFTDDELTTISFESYSELDTLGRCGITCTSVGQDLMPTEERGSIGMVKPTGWHTVKYDIVDGKYLYNRCHLIGFQLTGENANTRNLITGTRYLNIDGMLPFENMVADYVKETGNHVMYRVTPIFEGDNLVASGVLMEGYSVEDKGDGICYCVYAYNVQPGVEIDYATGESNLIDTLKQEVSTPSTPSVSTTTSNSEKDNSTENTPSSSTPTSMTYILNTNSKKFHYPTCSSVGQMNESNKKDFNGTRDELVSQGYSPCGRCKP